MNGQNEQKTLDISWETIFKFFVVIVFIYLIFVLRDILIWILFALIISTLLAPLIDFGQERKIPRVVSVFFIYFGSLLLLGIFAYPIITSLVIEIGNLIDLAPQYFKEISPILEKVGAFEGAKDLLALLGRELGRLLAIPLDIILGAVFVAAVSFFLTIEEKPIQKIIKTLFPNKYEGYVLSLWMKCQKDISAWFWARILGCLFIFLSSLLAFFLFDINYPFSLALIAGVFNFVPYIGILAATIIIFIVIALEDLSLVIFVLIVFTIINQIESNLITPMLMKKAINISPAMVLISLAIGGTLWGVAGAILAIPLFGILSNFIGGYLKMKKQEEKGVIL